MEEDVPAEGGTDEQLEQQEVDEEQEEVDVPRPLGSFMTPQPSAVRASSVFSDQLGLSVQGPQRIRIMQPWRVKDLVVPPPPITDVKREDPEPKEYVSKEEKSVSPFILHSHLQLTDLLLNWQAIRARRKSAFMTPDPADSQIPGSRRMSTILRPAPPTAPSIPSSSKKPFIKPDPNSPEEEEDTEVLLEKVKAKIEDLRRRQCIGLGPPPLERQRSRSPTKPDAESLFWGSDSITSMRIDQVGDKGDVGTVHSHPQGEDEDIDDDEVEEQEVIRQTTPVRSWDPSTAKLPPKTPKMDGMRGLFADPKAVLPTPAMGGIKELFNKPTEPGTPAYGGVRDMFKTAAPVIPGTPILEGLGDLLNTPAAYRKQPLPEATDVTADTTTAEPEIVIPGTKAAAAVRKRKVVAEAKKPVEESAPPTIGVTRPLKIGRPKKALKVNNFHASVYSPVLTNHPRKRFRYRDPPEPRRQLMRPYVLQPECFERDHDSFLRVHRALVNLCLALSQLEGHELPQLKPKLRLKNNPSHHKPPTLLEVKLYAELVGHRMSLRIHLPLGSPVDEPLPLPRRRMESLSLRQRNRVPRGQLPGGGPGTPPFLTRISPILLQLSRNLPEGSVSRRSRRRKMMPPFHPRPPHTKGH